MTTIISGSSPSITFSDSTTQTTAYQNSATVSVNAQNTFGFKNRIINGGMVIDQRNAGASVTITDTANYTYTLDRWAAYTYPTGSKFSVQQSSTAPTGFINSLKVTSLSSYSIGSSDIQVLKQAIEGLNVADLAWGTANAKSITLSFWVYSTGLTYPATFGGSFTNNAFNRSYPFSYSITAGSTWQQISVTVAGDTSGTWLTTNASGINLSFGLGCGSTYSGTAGSWASADYRSVTGATSVVGTSGATLYITGVQVEVGTQATSFDFRDYGRELMLCQRYYFKTSSDAATLLGVGFIDSGTTFICQSSVPVPMRTSATLITSGTASNYRLRWAGSQVNTCNAVPTINSTVGQFIRLDCSVASGLTTGYGGFLIPNGTSCYLGYDAEL